MCLDSNIGRTLGLLGQGWNSLPGLGFGSTDILRLHSDYIISLVCLRDLIGSLSYNMSKGNCILILSCQTVSVCMTFFMIDGCSNFFFLSKGKTEIKEFGHLRWSWFPRNCYYGSYWLFTTFQYILSERNFKKDTWDAHDQSAVNVEGPPSTYLLPLPLLFCLNIKIRWFLVRKGPLH